jgi:hypothetical protein
MEQTKLSPLAEKLFQTLNSLSYIYSLESTALQLSEDPFISPERRNAYREIWEHAKNDY